MRLAFHLSDFTRPGGSEAIGPRMAAAARAADEGGAAAVTVMDHYLQLDGQATAEEPMLEAYTTLGFLAGETRRVQLGALVTGVTYRHPGLLAKIVTTLDVLSEGRGFLGLGAAWYDREHEALGVPYPALGQRFEMLDETLAICKQMWSDDDGPFEGKHFSLAETLCVPPPVRRPRPPILIGGGGERKTLRLVARHADACNLFAMNPDVFAHKLEVLRGHCDAEGTDYDAISKTILTGGGNVLDDPDGFIKRMARFAELGVEQVWINNRGVEDDSGWISTVLERLGDPLAQLGPA